MAGTGGKPAGRIKFSSYNLPALEDGLYEIELSQQFRASAGNELATIPVQKKYFAALGPRFTLNPSEISVQFPPPGTSGNYFNILPHIIFTRSILPWERRLDSSLPHTPWLTLVAITHEEAKGWQDATGNPDLLTVRSGTLRAVCSDAAENDIVFPALNDISMEPGETPQEQLSYIDIPEPLLKLVLPDQDELPLLASVRQSADTPIAGQENPKYPTLICNRLPQPGQENTVYLLSLEKRTDVYNDLSAVALPTAAPTPTAAPKIYRFVVLSEWRFASVTPNQTFEQLLLDADTPTNPTQKSTFKLASVGNPDADRFLEKGYIPLTHQGRQGNRMVSWYRGPFLPGSETAPPTLPNPSQIQSPDKLIRVYSDVGMFDVSYAAAWNVGRSLILQDKRISLALFDWKRACTQAAKANKPSHLPGNAPLQPPLPAVIGDWFARLARLEQVPFGYLVPDQALLPPESLQFLCVDKTWVQLLLQGAFAVGDIASADSDIEDSLFAQLPQPNDLSGFILRSKVVSGWPHMLVNGFDTKPTSGDPPFMSNSSPLTQFKYRLGPDTLLMLFEGMVKGVESIEFYLHAETIHFGVDYEGQDPPGIPSPCYIKRLRDSEGNPVQPTGSPCGADRSVPYISHEWVRIPFKIEGTGVLNTNELSTRLSEALSLSASGMSAAEFAYQMIEGVPKVRFTLVTS